MENITNQLYQSTQLAKQEFVSVIDERVFGKSENIQNDQQQKHKEICDSVSIALSSIENKLRTLAENRNSICQRACLHKELASELKDNVFSIYFIIIIIILYLNIFFNRKMHFKNTTFYHEMK